MVVAQTLAVMVQNVIELRLDEVANFIISERLVRLLASIDVVFTEFLYSEYLSKMLI